MLDGLQVFDLESLDQSPLAGRLAEGPAGSVAPIGKRPGSGRVPRGRRSTLGATVEGVRLRPSRTRLAPYRGGPWEAAGRRGIFREPERPRAPLLNPL